MIGLVDCVSVGGASARLCFCRGAMIGPVDSVSTIEVEVGMSAGAVCRPVFVFCFGDIIGLFDCVSAGDVSARLCFCYSTVRCCGDMIALVDCVSASGVSARLCFRRGATRVSVGLSFGCGDMIGLVDCVSAGYVSADTHTHHNSQTHNTFGVKCQQSEHQSQYGENPESKKSKISSKIQKSYFQQYISKYRKTVSNQITIKIGQKNL